MTPEQLLKKYWGYSHFRPLQKEIIQSILNGTDTVALLPTGGGKSLCFQIPALLLPGLTIVISPLISLMKDQVDRLTAQGIPALYLSSIDSTEKLQVDNKALQEKRVKILYVSPERLQNQQFQSLLLDCIISLVVIDEAHCVSIWGHDFRPQYQNIHPFISQLSTRPIVCALTATATQLTKKDIINSLRLQHPAIFSSSFNRAIQINVCKVETATERELQLFAFLKDHNRQAGIVYVATQHATKMISNRLNDVKKLLGIGRVGYYHGGLSPEERQQTQQDFLDNKLQLLVATTAFGMGIDKSNIDFVIHFHPSASIENYYQEIGRAGRGGQNAQAVTFLLEEDFAIQLSLTEKSQITKKTALEKLAVFKSYTSSNQCRMKYILHYFEENTANCQQCDNCIKREKPLEKILHQKKEKLTRLLQWRKAQAKSAQTHESFILQDNQICYLSLYEIKETNDLKTVPGIGTGWLQLWGNQLFQAMVQ